MRMFSLKSFEDSYQTDIVDLAIGERKFQFHTPKYIEPFIDPESPLRDFPLWAKLWDASLVLAQFMSSQPTAPSRRILEIGSGLGIVGISAASFGHRITLSDYDLHALAFSRANAMLNHLPDLPVVRLDWNQPDLTGRFDWIIGSEVVYKDEHFPFLRNLFEKVLKPEGEVILVSEIRQIALKFYETLQNDYHIRVQKKVLRSDSQETPILFSRMRQKNSQKCFDPGDG
jgi:predicted nicotinamide N-methyase